MKANEMPKKIYIQPDAQDCWFMVNNLNNTLVEYTYTDAFIEKACEYLNKTCRRFILTERDIEDFKNYMNGE